MLEDIAIGITLFATWQNVVAIAGGVVIGVIIGAIPGMGAAMAVALALPFTFYMDPITGILMLTGIYKGTYYGGSASAILINTPGTPAAACTTLDGYPLARKGEARRALDIALYASCVADFLSNLSLILFAGVIAGFALRFGPPEFFALVVFSMTIIAGVSGDSLMKGIAAAALGFLAATVGQDLFYGSPRLTFDSSNLLGGLSFVPVLIGLFAIPQILDQFNRRLLVTEKIATTAKAIGATFADFRYCLPSIIRGSVIGVILGAIPGIGGAPAAFLSYSEARRTSARRENFGKGELEGVAASEAGNNGVCGATLIPLLSLGVPGDIVTAVLLGAFMIHGLQPGPLMFHQNIHLIYAIFAGLLLSTVVLYIAGKIAIRLLSRIVDIPDNLIFPSVLVLCFFGAYVVNGSSFDVLIMIIAGLVGYLMLKTGLPTAPFLIAFVLGPLFEDNLRRSLLMSGGDLGIFVRGPITWFFLALTILTVVSIGRRSWQDFRKQRLAAAEKPG
ncbi:MAG: tripartite tricarboxylate transporter permease [Aquisalimonadaceae bacterium]